MTGSARNRLRYLLTFALNITGDVSMTLTFRSCSGSTLSFILVAQVTQSLPCVRLFVCPNSNVYVINELRSGYLAHWFILILDRSNSKVKVIGQSLWSQENKGSAVSESADRDAARGENEQYRKQTRT